ncbi:MAG: hypothetical protein JWR89_1846 [Tardiphaga sp.]|uniref:hypothetical protein n=1 Tax=Tardiphaga sp. TaxID=1926292 RepID=UPI00262CA4A7|nr:hypothetical protein [Tardiphaga sp.]MDB5501944.1 hypothetical protein [Tardiphaga sp.]
MPEVVEPEPVGAIVEPLGEVPAPMVLPEGFIELLAPLFTAPDVPAPEVPEPVVPAVAPELDPAVPPEAPALPLACAKASDEVRVSAEANTMVEIFMSILQVADPDKSPMAAIVPSAAAASCPLVTAGDFTGSGVAFAAFAAMVPPSHS